MRRSPVSFLRYPLALALLLAIFASGCATPPDKEMNQARGAIEAARAAGAEQYAPAEYQAANAAFKRAEDAVAQRDYRQALAAALDSQEQAENAAKRAADQKAVVRSEAERNLGEVQSLLATAHERLKAVQTARGRRAPSRAERTALAGPERSIADADAAVQKARAALGNNSYLDARNLTAGLAARLRAAIDQIDRAAAATAATRRRH